MRDPEGLDFRICIADAQGSPKQVIARATNLTIAQAAYKAALKTHPHYPLSLLMRARLISHRPAQPVGQGGS